MGGVSAMSMCGLICILAVPIAWWNMSAIIPPNHVGIRYNAFSKAVDYSDYFVPGRHFAGPMVSFILFPTSILNSQMELVSRTSEGYPLTLKMSFQYQIIPEHVLELYRAYNVKYELVIVRNARDAMMKAVSQYSATDFFMKRQSIIDDMHKLLQERLIQSYVNCWWIQFDDVQQSHTFEDNLLRAQLQEWFVYTKEAQQIVSAIQANTSVLKAEFEKNISIVNSTAIADCALLISKAEAQAQVFLREAEANATLMVDSAQATSSTIVRQTAATGELKYQAASAEGNKLKLTEEASANKRSVALEGLRLKYWKELLGLSAAGLVQLQRIVGNSYKKLEDVNFFFGFENSYATADGNAAAKAPSARTSAARVAELAAIGGGEAGAAAANAVEAGSHSAGSGRALSEVPGYELHQEQESFSLPFNWEHVPQQLSSLQEHPEF